MIFVVLGTQKFQLNRLLKTLDQYVEEGKLQEEILAQIGYSDYLPKRYQYVDFLDKDDFDKTIEKVFDPRYLFMIIAIILFVTEIAVRKFKFKWLHEIIREARDKKQS